MSADRITHAGLTFAVAVKPDHHTREPWKDFDRLRAWCNDEWHWCVVVVVTLLDTDGEETHLSASLGGIESDSPDYHQEVAQGLARNLAHEIGARRIRVQA